MVFAFMPGEAHTRGRIKEASLPSVTKEKEKNLNKQKNLSWAKGLGHRLPSLRT